MSRQEEHDCTSPDCSRLTSLYLCTECIVRLDSLLADVPALVQLLDGPISRTSVTSPPSGGSAGHAASKPPVNLDALLLKAWLCQLPGRAYSTALEDPDAGQVLFMAGIWVPQARSLVWGPEERKVFGQCQEPIDYGLCEGRLSVGPDDVSAVCPSCGTVHQLADLETRLREKVRGTPMAPRPVREFLQSKTKIVVSKFDFENWVKHGKLPYVLARVTTGGKESKLYYPGDVLTVAQDMRAKRRY